MLAKVQKWGDSLALRIPKAFAIYAHLEDDNVVDISMVEGQIVVKPLIEPALTLEKLLAGINKSNLHHEVDTGIAMGKEVW